ncbi:MAG: hypothetical protein ACKO17_07375, partial [Bacteroidota bacterium]
MNLQFSLTLPYFLLTLGMLQSPTSFAQTPPPDVRPQPETTVIHGDTLVDPYRWLNQRENPEVLDYLRAENRYA